MLRRLRGDVLDVARDVAIVRLLREALGVVVERFRVSSRLRERVRHHAQRLEVDGVNAQ